MPGATHIEQVWMRILQLRSTLQQQAAFFICKPDMHRAVPVAVAMHVAARLECSEGKRLFVRSEFDTFIHWWGDQHASAGSRWIAWGGSYSGQLAANFRKPVDSSPRS